MNIAKISSYSAFASVAFFSGVPTTAPVMEDIPIAEPVPVVVEVATLAPALIPVCTCESGQGTGEPQHWNIHTLDVLHGKVNNNDIGMCQINTEDRNGHVKMSERLGLDVWTEQGNIKYANWLYEQEGLTPWNSSRSCWGK